MFKLLNIKNISSIFLAISFVFVIIFFKGLSNSETIISIPKNSNAIQVIKILQDENVMVDSNAFRVGLKILGLSKSIKAGDFKIEENISLFSLLFLITDSKNIHNYSVTIVEGWNKREVMNYLNSNNILVGEPITSLEEGSLLPDTYFFIRGMSRQDIVKLAKKSLDDYIDSIWDARDPNLPYKTKREAIIMASLIEEESSYNDEKKIIAGVFVNRLRKNMKLQTDPTVAYGLGRDNADKLTRSDLKASHPYNTYVINGLPIGPITNPSRDAIQAALFPAKTDYLFFVANGKGGHEFSVTLSEHNKKVATWRGIESKIRKQQQENK